MRKVTLILKARVLVDVDEGIDTSQVVDALDIEDASSEGWMTLEDSEFTDWEVEDSR